MEKTELEEGTTLNLRYDQNGLIPCITTSAQDGEVLMMAYMNEISVQKTIETGQAHYWSRSRQELWHKGASSGNVQKVISMKTDCDQDCLWISVEMPLHPPENKEISCHTGRRGCFYREITLNNGRAELKEI